MAIERILKSCLHNNYNYTYTEVYLKNFLVFINPLRVHMIVYILLSLKG